jgi:hypothetical protein
MMARYNSPASLFSEGDAEMTLSVVLYATMVLALAAFVGILVVEVRGGRGESARPGRLAARSSRYGRGRTQQRRECPRTAAGCPRGARPASPLAPSRSRERPTPHSCGR